MLAKTSGRLGLAVLVAQASVSLAIASCKNPDEPAAAQACAAVAPPACVLHDGGDAPFVPCIRDECSLATLSAIISTELRAATRGATSASAARVRTVAQQMASDFEAQQANLTALEAQLAVNEVACDESAHLSADLVADLAKTDGLTGSAFDSAFVQSQIDALSEIKQTINFDLLGCAGNGNLKTTLRFDRLRSPDGGTSAVAYDGGAELGVVPDLAALQAIANEGGSDASID